MISSEEISTQLVDSMRDPLWHSLQISYLNIQRNSCVRSGMTSCVWPSNEWLYDPQVSEWVRWPCVCVTQAHGRVTAAICWSHHWLWHHHSPAVLTAHVSSLRRLYEQDGPYRQRDWFSHYGTMPLSPLCHPTSAKLTKKLSSPSSKLAWKHTKALDVTLL